MNQFHFPQVFFRIQRVYKAPKHVGNAQRVSLNGYIKYDVVICFFPKDKVFYNVKLLVKKRIMKGRTVTNCGHMVYISTAFYQ